MAGEVVILDRQGRQVVRLIGFGDRFDVCEPANRDAWLGSGSSSGHSAATSVPLLWEDRPIAHVAGTFPTRMERVRLWRLDGLLP